MTMMREKYFKGEIEGVEFFFKELTEAGGRKTVFHQFINSGVVKGEDLGEASNGFALSVYIAGMDRKSKAIETNYEGRRISGINDDYFDRKSAMIAVLKKSGALRLVHPTRGVLNVMIDGKYRISESISSSNKCNITVSFIVVDNQPIGSNPNDFVKVTGDLRTFELASGGVTTSRGDGTTLDTDDGFNVEDVTNLRNNVFDRCGWTVNELLADFGIQADFFKSSQSILNNVSEIMDLMEVSLQAISGTKDLSDVFRQIESLSFLNTGSKLGQIGLEIGRVFVAVENSIEQADQRYNFFKAFFDYNDNYKDKQVLTATSEPNIQTEENEILFRDYLQGLGSCYACNAIADYQYANEEELNTIAQEIDAQLKKQLLYLEDNTEIYNLLQRQRVVINEQIEKSRLTVRRVITVNVVNSSLTNICYSYYQSLDLLSDIQALNGFNNPSNINGEIKILSGGDI